MDLDAALEGFVRHLEAERRASPHTVKAYRRDLRGLVDFVQSKGATKIDVYVLRGWLGQLARTHAASSVARHVAAARTWMRWLRRRGAIAKSPAEELASPKVR